MKFDRILAGVALVAAALLTGCAHPISVAPDLARVSATVPPIDKSVGYYLSDASKAVEVTTPGGGGDKVRYFPYRDLEAGFYKALSESFTKVTKMPGARDAAAMRASGVQLLFTPDIKTDSSSPSPLTWPPTKFTITLTCVVTDATGQTVTTLVAQGNGQAEFDEFKANFSLSAVRAANDVLAKLVRQIAESPELRR